MNKKQLSLWLTALASEFIEGAADAFLVVSGGAAVAQSGVLPAGAALPALSPAQLLYSVLIGGAWYVAAYLKKTPLPSKLPLSSDEK